MKLYLAFPSLVLLLFAATGQAEEHTFRVIDQNTGQAVSNAVLAVESPAAEPLETEIVQKNRAFHPHILVIPTGSMVHFPNRDNTQHHVYSFSAAKTFDIELYAGQPEAPITFDKAGIVELGCNIHDHMQGFIVVTGNGIHGRTDDNGRVSLALPAAPRNEPISVSAWHPRLANNTRMVDLRVEMAPGGVTPIPLELVPEEPATSSMDMLQRRFEEL
jgi:plastocyanin